MARTVRPDLIDADNPEWTPADFRSAKPARDMMSDELFAALVHGSREERPSRHSFSAAPLVSLALLPGQMSSLTVRPFVFRHSIHAR